MVDGSEGGAGIETGLSLKGTDKDTVWGEQVVDGGTFCEELGVREDVKLASWLGVGLEDGSHRPGISI